MTALRELRANALQAIAPHSLGLLQVTRLAFGGLCSDFDCA